MNKFEPLATESFRFSLHSGRASHDLNAAPENVGIGFSTECSPKLLNTFSNIFH